MTTDDFFQTRELERQFTVRLQYEEDEPPVSLDGKVGAYVGSGVGVVQGPRLQGSIQWSLFEKQGEALCPSNLFGLITTNDSAEIRFDAMGFFLRADLNRPHQWRTTAAVHFVTIDPCYAWLDDILGVWEGQFDIQTYRHHYSVYASLKQGCEQRQAPGNDRAYGKEEADPGFRRFPIACCPAPLRHFLPVAHAYYECSDRCLAAGDRHALADEALHTISACRARRWDAR